MNTGCSKLDNSAYLEVDDFVKAFSLPDRIALAIRFVTWYSQNTKSKKGLDNLKRAIFLLESEVKLREQVKD